MIKQYDIVMTLVPKGEYPAGTYGVAVEVLPIPNATYMGVEVEIWDQYNYPCDEKGYHDYELKSLSDDEIKELEKRSDIQKILKMHG